LQGILAEKGFQAKFSAAKIQGEIQGIPPILGA
jgi:hypothetical protein